MNSKYDFTIVKHLRKKLNLTQEQVAEISGLTCPTIAAIESNRGLPSLRTLDQLSGVLQVSVTKLMTLAERRIVHKRQAKPISESDLLSKKRYLRKILQCAFGDLVVMHSKLMPGEVVESGDFNNKSFLKSIYVLSGELEVNICGDSYVLLQDESLLIDADMQYTCRVIKESEAVAFLLPRDLSQVIANLSF